MKKEDNKKVILYGIRGSGRKEIELFLDDHYEIKGYCDSAKEYSDYKFIDYKMFCVPEKLRQQEFDFIIITPKNIRISHEIKCKCLKEGIEENRIIQYALFCNASYPVPFEIFKKLSLKINFEAFIFGMSHAYKGINQNVWQRHIFNFAFNGNDLFHQYQLIRKMKAERVDFSGVKYCILELPYYIFNWDRSLSDSALRCLNVDMPFFGGGQIHHLDVVKDGVLCQYNEFQKMFKHKMTYNQYVYNNGMNYDIANKLLECDYNDISHVWKKKHTDTINENISYFEKMISLLNSMNKDMVLIVVVFPFNPKFYRLHFEIIEKMKECFYTILNDKKPSNMRVLDYFKYYELKENYFEDTCHLNTDGRNHFSRKLVAEIDKITKGM